jgi:uncharacterized membrane protein YcaP (DUF421 family)
MENAILPFDIQRLFFGDTPPLFMAEIAFRTLLIYAYAMLLLRWIGGRSVAQLSLVEFLLVIALGSAVGDSMFYPEVPLFHAMLVVTLVVVVSKGIDRLIMLSRRVKKAVDGRPALVVRDGCVVMPSLQERNLALSELYSLLRVQGIANLGEVRAAWLEPAGQLSVFRHDFPRPGLAIEPPPEVVLHPPAPDGCATICCTGCGAQAPEAPCASCGASEVTAAC